jgi:hypothetical protein
LLRIKILYENVNLLLMEFKIPSHYVKVLWEPSNTKKTPPPLETTPSPTKPCFRPGDTPALQSMHSTYMAVLTQGENQDRNVPRFEYGNTAP